MTWGDPRFGGDSTAAQHQLKNVQQIEASCEAFAAILGHGSVVTWGDPCSGGDSTDVQDQLQDVQQVHASYHAFAAVRGDGSVFTWGNPHAGGDSKGVQDQLDCRLQHADAAIPSTTDVPSSARARAHTHTVLCGSRNLTHVAS